MKYIQLNQGMQTIADNEDFVYLNQFKWYLSGDGYAARHIGGRKNASMVLMHREVNKTPEGKQTDHMNRNKLDNRKNNLRVVTPSESALNRGIRSDNTSGVKGVYRSNGKWCAELIVRGNRARRSYATFEEAVKGRRELELKNDLIFV